LEGCHVFPSSFSPLRRNTQETGCSVSRATNKTLVPIREIIWKQKQQMIVTFWRQNDTTFSVGTLVHLPQNSLFSRSTKQRQTVLS
jgi:hypothetical protein